MVEVCLRPNAAGSGRKELGLDRHHDPRRLRRHRKDVGRRPRFLGSGRTPRTRVAPQLRRVVVAASPPYRPTPPVPLVHAEPQEPCRAGNSTGPADTLIVTAYPGPAQSRFSHESATNPRPPRRCRHRCSNLQSTATKQKMATGATRRAARIRGDGRHGRVHGDKTIAARNRGNLRREGRQPQRRHLFGWFRWAGQRRRDYDQHTTAPEAGPNTWRPRRVRATVTSRPPDVQLCRCQAPGAGVAALLVTSTTRSDLAPITNLAPFSWAVRPLACG
jgi:hypothetical protein